MIDRTKACKSLTIRGNEFYCGKYDEEIPYSVTNIQVTIQGGGTLALTADGNILRIGLRHNIILQDVTLRGISTNTTQPAVYIAAGGLLTMKNGSTICDNGYRGVVIDNGQLIMESGIIRDNTTPTGGTGSSFYGAGVYIHNGGNLTMHGNAQISNNRFGSNNWYGYGAGIFVGVNSTILMEGGLISGNRSVHTMRGFGAGVYLDGTLIMNGGEISYNIASSNNLSSSGGGVYITETGSFTMNNGMVTDNNSSSTGGGVYVNNIFEMNGGTISNNSSHNGGGVYLANAWSSPKKFTLNGGTLSGNNAGSNGGGVYVDSGSQTTFSKTGGNITSNSASQNGRTAFMSGGPDRWRNANAGPNVQVDDLFWLND